MHKFYISALVLVALVVAALPIGAASLDSAGNRLSDQEMNSVLGSQCCSSAPNAEECRTLILDPCYSCTGVDPVGDPPALPPGDADGCQHNGQNFLIYSGSDNFLCDHPVNGNKVCQSQPNVQCTRLFKCTQGATVNHFRCDGGNCADFETNYKCRPCTSGAAQGDWNMAQTQRCVAP